MVVVDDRLVPTGDGATPLTPDELSELEATWIRTRGDLNLAEAQAIAAVQRSYARRVPALEVLLDDLWLRQLHKRMFAGVWGWAGSYRSTERNIGVDPRHVAISVRNLVADATVWFRTDDDPVVATARFHHRLVWIHPFPNGNGRHARLAADLCLRSLDLPALTWGRNLRLTDAQVRRRYIDALRAADTGDIQPLLAFVAT